MSGGYTKSRAKMSIPARSATQRIITCNRQTNDLNAPQAGVALPRNVHLPTLPMHANHVVSDCLFARSSPQNVFDRSPHAKELATNTHNPPAHTFGPVAQWCGRDLPPGRDPSHTTLSRQGKANQPHGSANKRAGGWEQSASPAV